MRDPKRIPVILDKLRRFWLSSPDLRFGQLFINLLTTKACDPRLMEDCVVEHALDSLISDHFLDTSSPADPLVAELARLEAAVRDHHAKRGHARCWENDAALYRAFGLEPVDPENPPVEEHRLRCDEYRASLYGVDVNQEPAHREKNRHVDEGDPEAVRLARHLADHELTEENTGLRALVRSLIGKLANSRNPLDHAYAAEILRAVGETEADTP